MADIAHMNELELRRAVRLLDGFCRQRNLQPGVTPLVYRRQGACLYLAETGGPDLLRLCLKGRGWQLHWPRAGGDWQPWPHLPEYTDLQGIADELEQAPLHVHWD